MHPEKLLLILFAALACGPCGFAEERRAPLDPLSGFELRLLDKKFPVQIKIGDKTEERDAPVWVYMPEKGVPQASLDDLTQPDDLIGGTSLLPAPPDGFGLRAMKVPIRESFVLADGRPVIVEIPVFVYFRHIASSLSSDDPPTSAAPDPAPAQAPPAGKGTQGETDRLRSQLVDLHKQFTALIPLTQEGTAKERLKVLVQQLDDIANAHVSKARASVDGSIDYNINP